MAPLPSEAATRRICFASTPVSEEAIDACIRVLRSGWLTTGPEVASFEQEFAGWVGAREAIAVSSCTAALEISLRALGLPPGSRVLTSTMTFCGAVSAILHAGLQPVLVDVEPETLMPSPLGLAEAVWRDGPADAMVVIHFAGQPAPVEHLAAAAGLSLSRIVEDAAHAIGAIDGTRAIGTIGAATCFSFYATKNLPIGEGGMITTADSRLAAEARSIRLHGMSHDAWRRYLPGASWRYEVAVDGIKANMTDIQAAIGRAQLRELNVWQERRTELAALYDACLSEVPGVRLPARPATGLHAWHLYVVQLELSELGRDAVISFLAERGIDCSVHFIPVHHHPYFQQTLSLDPSHFPNADRAFQRIVSLPFHVGMTDEDVRHVCDLLEEAIAQAGQASTLVREEVRA